MGGAFVLPDRVQEGLYPGHVAGGPTVAIGLQDGVGIALQHVGEDLLHKRRWPAAEGGEQERVASALGPAGGRDPNHPVGVSPWHGGQRARALFDREAVHGQCEDPVFGQQPGNGRVDSRVVKHVERAADDHHRDVVLGRPRQGAASRIQEAGLVALLRLVRAARRHARRRAVHAEGAGHVGQLRESPDDILWSRQPAQAQGRRDEPGLVSACPE